MLVAYDEQRNITDFGSLEIQGVYISGNLRRPFVHYMEDPLGQEPTWTGLTGNIIRGRITFLLKKASCAATDL